MHNTVKKNILLFDRNVMFWTEEHEKLMCREILAVDPFSGTRKGTVQRGAKWKKID